MKTLETHCQVCRLPLTITVEEPALFTDQVMMEMAVCDSCADDHDEQERNRISRYHRAIERECQDNYRHPYAD